MLRIYLRCVIPFQAFSAHGVEFLMVFSVIGDTDTPIPHVSPRGWSVKSIIVDC